MIAQRLGSRLGLALLLVAVASHGKVDAERIPTAPAFLWGPRAIVGGPSGRQQQVSYQTHESDVIGDLVRGLLSRGAGAGGRSVSDWLHAPALRDDAAPQAVLVFISKQVRSEHLSGAAGAALDVLKGALSDAASSLSLPHVSAGDRIAGQVVERLRAVADVVVHHFGDCELPSESGAAPAVAEVTAETVGGALTATQEAGQRAVLLVCPAADTMDAEMAELRAAHGAVAASERPYAAIFATQPDTAAYSGRSLLAEVNDVHAPAPPSSSDICDEKCQIQVSQLEAGMLILTILVALGFGTLCLGILDTPTRFATPKEHDR